MKKLILMAMAFISIANASLPTGKWTCIDTSGSGAYNIPITFEGDSSRFLGIDYDVYKDFMIPSKPEVLEYFVKNNMLEGVEFHHEMDSMQVRMEMKKFTLIMDCHKK